jgi:hypothetical protein
MKSFIRHALSISQCAEELKEFEVLLASKAELKEREEIIPFFKKNINLAAFLGTYVPDIANPDLIANEYDVFGDFACDLAIGDSNSQTYLFVEFEDAKSESIFVKNATKSTPEWGPRMEHGFSQVIDWFWKITDMEKSDDYENRFGARHVAIHGLVVVGRDQSLQVREKARLKWRQDHIIVHSKRVSIITFDQLARDLRYRLSRYPEAAKADQV